MNNFHYHADLRQAFLVLEVGYIFLLTINGQKVINVSVHDSHKIYSSFLDLKC